MPYTDASGVQIPVGTDAFNPIPQFKTWQDKNATYNNRVVVALDTDRTALAAPVLRQGLRCYVEATSAEWVYDGTTWEEPTEDTGWLTPTLQNGWSAVTDQPIRYRRRNGLVFLKGQATGGSAAAIFTLPAGFRPAITVNQFYTVLGDASQATQSTRLYISPEGAISGVPTYQPHMHNIPPFIAEA